jgi:hypothetical protein
MDHRRSSSRSLAMLAATLFDLPHNAASLRHTDV